MPIETTQQQSFFDIIRNNMTEDTGVGDWYNNFGSGNGSISDWVRSLYGGQSEGGGPLSFQESTYQPPDAQVNKGRLQSMLPMAEYDVEQKGGGGNWRLSAWRDQRLFDALKAQYPDISRTRGPQGDYSYSLYGLPIGTFERGDIFADDGPDPYRTGINTPQRPQIRVPGISGGLPQTNKSQPTSGKESFNKRFNMNDPSTQAGGFAQSITQNIPAMMQQVAQLEAHIANRGVFGIEGIEAIDMQNDKIRARVEETTAKSLQYLSNAAGEGRSNIMRSVSRQVGARASKQAGKMAKRIAEVVATTVAPAEQNQAISLLQDRGEKLMALDAAKAELVKQNLLSRTSGIQGVKESVALMMDYINNRTWDTSLEKYMRSWSPERQGEARKELQRLQSLLGKQESQYAAYLQDWLAEKQFERESQFNFWDDAFGPVVGRVGFTFGSGGGK